MRIVHSLRGESQEKRGDAGFILANKRGDYYLSGEDNDFTAYQGWHIFDPHTLEYFKVIDCIYLDNPPETLTNNFYEVCREGNSGKEIFMLTDDGLVVDYPQANGICTIELDFRGIHDYDVRGRIYEITREEEYIIIEYSKYQDFDLQGTPKKYYLAIIGAVESEPVSTWKKKHYVYDAARGSRNEMYVYETLRIRIKPLGRLVFAFSNNKTAAKVNAMTLARNFKEHKDKLLKRGIAGLDKNMAHNCALHSLQGMTINPNPQVFGIIAGRPWFYQFWSRDELISSVYLLQTGKYETMKEILMKYLGMLLEDGRIPNRHPHSSLGSADGIGWLFKRIGDLILRLESLKMLDKHFSIDEIRAIYDAIDKSITLQNQKYGKDHLLYNHEKETWMDTTASEDTREGARIEIQALHLYSHALAKKLGKMLADEKYKLFEEEEKTMRKKVREVFFDGRLADGFTDSGTDWTCRPNVFLAYYSYPLLLTNREWKKVFEWALSLLWLEWGGLATIDKNNPLYCDEYTGMDNRSYHRGDSWFFVNNIAAICLHEVSPAGFQRYVKMIADASTHEILYSGLAGHAAEVSSARKLKSQGCLCQAWSAATFCEMMDKI